MAYNIPNTKKGQLLAPVSSAGAYTVTLSCDTKGFSFLTVRFNFGLVGGAMTALTIVSGTDNSTFGTTVFAFGTTTIAKPDTAGTTYEVYIPIDGNSNRYYTITATASATTLLQAEYILERGNEAPDTNTERGLTNSALVIL